MKGLRTVSIVSYENGKPLPNMRIDIFLVGLVKGAEKVTLFISEHLTFFK